LVTICVGKFLVKPDPVQAHGLMATSFGNISRFHKIAAKSAQSLFIGSGKPEKTAKNAHR
jgi:hypothetical protein